MLIGAFGAISLAQGPSYDLVIRNARIVDGTGAPWYRGELAIRGDTIAAVAPRVDAGGARVVDAGGKVVAPGFIDIHTHARRGIFQVPTADNYVRQGVTTLMEGPDGATHTLLGIYEVDGDGMKTCLAPPGADRPTEFASKEGTGHMYYVWKRAKAEKK